jgi:iron complex transport system permease protein
LAYSRPLRAVLAGDENARALGVSVGRLRMGMLLLSSLLTATLVANCGGIGFVGLMIPHIVRRLLSQKQDNVFIYTALLGGVFMVWVDVLARTLSDNAELPIGVITAAIGSVFFLLVLSKKDSRKGYQ